MQEPVPRTEQVSSNDSQDAQLSRKPEAQSTIAIRGGHPTDILIRTLAAQQHGLVTRSQLKTVGVPDHRIDYRIRVGVLEPEFRGVFRVGPLTTRFGRHMAAVLACGDTAVVSHRSAAELWDLPIAERRASDPVEVSVERGSRRRGRGIRVYRRKTLPAEECTRVEGVPITSPSRTLLDIAGTAGARELEQVVAAAERNGLASREELAGLLSRYPRQVGSSRLLSLITDFTGPAYLRSEAESRLLVLIRKSQLSTPECNGQVNGFEVDFLWRTERLIVEMDGRAFHVSYRAFERDRKRDAIHIAAGYRVIRVTWRQLTETSEAVLARLAQALVR